MERGVKVKRFLKGIGLMTIYGTVIGAGVEFGKKIIYRVSVKREIKKIDKLLAKNKEYGNNE